MANPRLIEVMGKRAGNKIIYRGVWDDGCLGVYRLMLRKPKLTYDEVLAYSASDLSTPEWKAQKAIWLPGPKDWPYPGETRISEILFEKVKV